MEEGTWRARLRSSPTADCSQPGRKKKEEEEGRDRKWEGEEAREETQR